MYLYSFDRFFGVDKVCLLTETTGKKKIKSGDLLVFGNQYFLALGETLVFAEQYRNVETMKRPNVETIYPKFIGKITLNLLHRMVEHHYTTYKSVIRLFFAANIEKLLQRETKSIKSIKSKVHKVETI